MPSTYPLNLRGLLRRQPRRATCAWHGSHVGAVSVGVDTAWPCGHPQDRTAPTCVAHLNHLLSQGGMAERETPCSTYGAVGAARVVATHDLC